MGIDTARGRSMQPQLGQILRDLRHERGLPLHAVAAATGLSKSFISLVEQGRSDLSVNRLMRVCEFYGLRPSELLAGGGGNDVHHFVSPGEGSEITVLGPPEGRGAMLPALTVYEPRARTDLFSHPGEEFVFVVEGRLVLHLAGERIELGTGDSHYFDAATEHRFENPDRRRRAVKLSVQSEIRW